VEADRTVVLLDGEGEASLTQWNQEFSWMHVISEEQVTVEGWLLRDIEHREDLDDNQILEYDHFELVTRGHSVVQEVLPCVASTEVGDELHQYHTRDAERRSEVWRRDRHWVRLTGRMARIVGFAEPDDDYQALITDSWEPMQEPSGATNPWL
jgi:hypothetical protein